MRYFLDTEFIDNGKTIDLISIGIVAGDGRTYYAEPQECDLTLASEWVVNNVIPHLTGDKKPRKQIADEISEFIIPGDDPQIWAYYGAYDWVVFCQLYGRMLDIPSHIPHFFHDVKSFSYGLGNPKLPSQHGVKHHALGDAFWVKNAYDYLVKSFLTTTA